MASSLKVAVATEEDENTKELADETAAKTGDFRLLSDNSCKAD